MIEIPLSLMRRCMFTLNPPRTTRSAALSRRRFKQRLTALGLAALAALSGGCGRPRQPAHIDLLSLLASAEKRPFTGAKDAFIVRNVDFDGGTVPAVVVPQPSRIVWTIRIPLRATLTAHAGLLPDGNGKYAGEAVFRVGVLGGRVHERVYERRLAPISVEADRAFVPIAVDLSAWAGWQWSLFYRPSETAWGLVLSVDGTKSTDTPLWLAPEVNGIR